MLLLPSGLNFFFVHGGVLAFQAALLVNSGALRILISLTVGHFSHCCALVESVFWPLSSSAAVGHSTQYTTVSKRFHCSCEYVLGTLLDVVCLLSCVAHASTCAFSIDLTVLSVFFTLLCFLNPFDSFIVGHVSSC